MSGTGKYFGRDRRVIEQSTDESIALCEDAEVAEQIARKLSLHDELLALCKRAKAHEEEDETRLHGNRYLGRLRAVIALAEGRQATP